MSTLDQLRTEIANLEAQTIVIRQQGEYLQGVRLEKTCAGGTASISAKGEYKYARLRAGRGRLLPNGKKSQYIKLEQVTRYEAAIARGKSLQYLEKQIEQCQKKITATYIQAKRLGIDL